MVRIEIDYPDHHIMKGVVAPRGMKKVENETGTRETNGGGSKAPTLLLLQKVNTTLTEDSMIGIWAQMTALLCLVNWCCSCRMRVPLTKIASSKTNHGERYIL